MLWQADVNLNTQVQVQRLLVWFCKSDLPVSAALRCCPHTLLSARTNELCCSSVGSLQRAELVSYERWHRCPLALDLKQDKFDSTAASQQSPETVNSLSPQAESHMGTAEALHGVSSPQVSKATTRNVTSGSGLSPENCSPVSVSCGKDLYRCLGDSPLALPSSGLGSGKVTRVQILQYTGGKGQENDTSESGLKNEVYHILQ